MVDIPTPTGGRDDDAFDASGGAADREQGGESMSHDRAAALREAFAARREAEAMRGEISRLRQEAAAEAERIVGEAQDAAKQLVESAQMEAEMVREAARSHASGLINLAETEAAEIRDEAAATIGSPGGQGRPLDRPELDEARRQVSEVIERGQPAVAKLLESLRSAVDSASELQGVLAQLSEPTPTTRLESELDRELEREMEHEAFETTPWSRAVPEERADRGPAEGSRVPEPRQETVPGERGDRAPEPRPLGWLFRAPQH